jgi:molybdopterin molybdotransferase
VAAALSFDEARRVVLEHVAAALAELSAREAETVPLEEADGRILAEPVLADRDYPPTARSVRDGYAVRAADLPGPLTVIGEARAGHSFSGELKPGQAVEIMTGAAVPEGADAVIMVEYSSRSGSEVRFNRTAKSGEAINPQAWECRGGATLVEPGRRLDYTRIATAAMVGRRSLAVYRRPRVAVVPTGDEVVEIDTASPSPQQVRNSNAWSLAAQVRRAGGSPVMLGIAPDRPEATRALIESGLACDLLLLSGGVSAGKYDFVEQALADCGAEFYFDRVRIQPGQPLVFGRARGVFFFGLPGNPASTMVTFEVFARAALRLIAGERIEDAAALPFFRAILTAPFTQRPGLTRFLPAVLSGDGATLSPVSWRGSADIASLARANAYLVSDPDRDAYAAGDSIQVMLK